MMLKQTPLSSLGLKHGDFVKFSRYQMVWTTSKNGTEGLPMYRDVEQYGWLSSSNTINGRVHIRSTHDHGVLGKMMSVPVEGLITVAKWNGNTDDFPRTTVEGFQVTRPVFDKPEGEGILTYAGGDIPLPRNAQVTARKTAAQLKRGLKKAAKANGRKYEVRYKKTKDLDAEIQRQKDLINGKVSG